MTLEKLQKQEREAQAIWNARIAKLALGATVAEVKEPALEPAKPQTKAVTETVKPEKPEPQATASVFGATKDKSTPVRPVRPVKSTDVKPATKPCCS